VQINKRNLYFAAGGFVAGVVVVLLVLIFT